MQKTSTNVWPYVLLFIIFFGTIIVLIVFARSNVARQNYLFELYKTTADENENLRDEWNILKRHAVSLETTIERRNIEIAELRKRLEPEK